MPIVRHGHARMRRLEPPVARPRGHRRPTTTATAQPILTTGVLTRRNSRRNVKPGLQRQPRLFAAALLQSATHAFLFGAANVFRAEPQLSSSVAFLLRTEPQL